jgi:hypothetical protein
MIDVVDRDLRARFEPLVDRLDDSDWAELQPRRRPHAWIAIAAALVLAVVVTAPAVGLPGRIVRLFDDAQPAPPQVAKSFSDFDQIVSSDLAEPPREALQTRIGPGEKAVLWVTPTTAGGFCSLLKLQQADGSSEGAGGECDPGPAQLSVDVSLRPALIRGFSSDRAASGLELDFQDGTTASIPFVWVSKPVATGFFVYAVPSGRRPQTLALRSSDGHEIAHTEVHGFPLP